MKIVEVPIFVASMTIRCLSGVIVAPYEILFSNTHFWNQCTKNMLFQAYRTNGSNWFDKLILPESRIKSQVERRIPKMVMNVQPIPLVLDSAPNG